MAPRPYQLHARKEIVTIETISRPVTSFAERETAEVEADLWRKAGFTAEVVDVSAGETPTFDPGDAAPADDPDAPPAPDITTSDAEDAAVGDGSFLR